MHGSAVTDNPATITKSIYTICMYLNSIKIKLVKILVVYNANEERHELISCIFALKTPHIITFLNQGIFDCSVCTVGVLMRRENAHNYRILYLIPYSYHLLQWPVSLKLVWGPP